MNIEYPIISCLHPRKIVNSNGEEVLVPCGHCQACLSRKSSDYVQQIELESLQHKYCLFVTLTFDNKNIPMIRLKKRFDNFYDIYGYRWKKETTKPYDSIVYDEEALKLLQEKFNLNGNIPILVKSDLQKFIKRIRRKLNYIYDGQEEKLRYFGIGEYGPLHFRPHFHILFWFENEETYETLLQIIPELWKYGSCDCSRSQGKCAHYVAGYLNSYINLPKIFRDNKFKPFNCHSKGLGLNIFDGKRDKIYETSDINSLCTDYNRSGKVRTTHPWQALETRYFPRCVQYSQLSLQGKYDAYRCYNIARAVAGDIKSLRELSEVILDNCIQLSEYYKELKFEKLDKINLDMNYINFYRWFSNLALHGQYHLLNSAELNTKTDTYKKIAQRIERSLRTSKHFIDFVCNSNPNLYNKQFMNIINYYNSKEIERLRKFYSFQETNPQYFEIMYNDTFTSDKLEKTDIYKQFTVIVDEKFNNNIKHKLLNDKNKIFNNI